MFSAHLSMSEWLLYKRKVLVFFSMCLVVIIVAILSASCYFVLCRNPWQNNRTHFLKTSNRNSVFDTAKSFQTIVSKSEQKWTQSSLLYRHCNSLQLNIIMGQFIKYGSFTPPQEDCLNGPEHCCTIFFKLFYNCYIFIIFVNILCVWHHLIVTPVGWVGVARAALDGGHGKSL